MQWEPLFVWKLSGPLYDNREGVQVQHLPSLVALQRAIGELARSLQRERRLRLEAPEPDIRIRVVEDGCVQTTVLMAVPERRGQTSLLPLDEDKAYRAHFDTYHEAVAILQKGLRGLRPLPEGVLAHIRRATIEDATIRQEVLSPPPAVPFEDAEAVDSPGAVTGVLRETAHYYAPAEAARSASGRRDEQALGGSRSQWRSDAEQAPTDGGDQTESGPETASGRADVSAEALDRLDHLTPPKPKADDRLESRTIVGEVTMVAVSGEARIRLDDGTELPIAFSPADEDSMTSALKAHRSVRVRARGTARFDPRNRLRSFTVGEGQIRIGTLKDSERPGPGLFERLAEEDPGRLAAYLVDSTLLPAVLAEAAEIAGTSLPAGLCVPLLLSLLEHRSATVREGCLYGLAHHLGLDVVRGAVLRVAESDPSLTLQLVARGLLQ